LNNSRPSTRQLTNPAPPLRLHRLPGSIPGPAPCVTFSGDYEGVAVHVVWTGRDAKHGVDLVGTVPASLATYLALQVGAAGSWLVGTTTPSAVKGGGDCSASRPNCRLGCLGAPRPDPTATPGLRQRLPRAGRCAGEACGEPAGGVPVSASSLSRAVVGRTPDAHRHGRTRIW
jgi:hypothetical protein